LQLSDSEGLRRLVLFSGLEYTVLLRPGVLGEPLLTAQGIYFLDRMQSVAHVRANAEGETLQEEVLEYMLDNYLFEFCKIYPNSRMTFKVAEPVFWQDDHDSMYSFADYRHSETLVLDMANDESVLSIEPLDPTDSVDLGDWDIGRNYGRENIEPYVAAIGRTLEKKLIVQVMPTSERDGYLGKLRAIKAIDSYIDYFQAMALDLIFPTDIGAGTTSVDLEKSVLPGAQTSLRIERVTVQKQHRPILLAHFFSGVKELNPLKAYLSFYNVLEYYFEEAPLLLSRAARTELEQLRCTLEILVSDDDVAKMLASYHQDDRRLMASDMPTSSSVRIKALDANATSVRDELARWLYDIRCAVVHSKKTRRGQATASFEPYSAAAKNVQVAIPMVRILAVLCIEKDTAQRAAGQP
jgi:hypothetical protein